VNDYYKLLEIDPGASPEVIINAYRALVKKYHPDRYYGHASKKMVEERLVEINEAYAILSNPEARQRYDVKLANYRTREPQLNVRQHRLHQLKKVGFWFLFFVFLFLVFRTLGQLMFFTPMGKLLLVGLAGLIILRFIKRRKAG
jgi:DnaJ-class molecular chaperone